MIRRRQFIKLLGGAAAWPVAARAQQPKMPVIGFLSSDGASDPQATRMRALRQGLSETGYIEGRNLTIEYRWAQSQIDRLPGLAADLTDRQVSVIVTFGLPAALAAKVATTTIPIVSTGADDPVAAGLVTSLNRPGGNLTGVVNLGAELGPKRLELLHELVSGATSIALLVNPKNPGAETQSRDLQAAARTLGLQLHILPASNDRDFDSVFTNLVELRAGALVISVDGFLSSRLEQLAALALRHAVPAICQLRVFTAAGGLMSYGSSNNDERQAGIYAGRILKGEKPADLPVMRAAKFELTINIKTAKAFGLTVPPALLARADEVIE
jgi:putative ABC transport system substrate-binding protein